ncbi:hypothetical protein ABKN59_007271 [Abortiporus biennis]
MVRSAQIRHRFQNSLDMVAARPVFVDLTVPSGTNIAWSTMDSPTLGRHSSMYHRIELVQDEPSPLPSPLPRLMISVPPVEAKQVNNGNLLSPVLAGQHVPEPLDIKKLRRRALTRKITLVLPPSPLPAPRSPHLSPPALSPSPASTPQTALTFTADWDLQDNTFVFTPFETSHPLSAFSSSPTTKRSPVPDDVRSEVVTVAESVKRHVADRSPVSPPTSPGSSISTPCTDIFDKTPLSPSIYSLYSQAQTPALSSADSPIYGFEMCHKAENSSSSLSREIVIKLFEEELHRTIPAVVKQDFDKGCYEEMDEDLLRAPIDAFTQMLWESTDDTPISLPPPNPPPIPEAPVEVSRFSVDTDILLNEVTQWGRDSGQNPPYLPRLLIPSVDGHSRRPHQPTRRKRKFSEDLVGRLHLFIR